MVEPPGVRYAADVGVKEAWELARDTISEWSGDNAAQMGAALAFYTFFSLAPLLVIVISVSGLVLGPQAAEGRIVSEIGGIVGPGPAQAIEWLILKAQSRATQWAGLIGFGTLLVGASWIVGALQNTFDQIWKAPPREIKHIIRKYVLSYVMVLALGFISLVSLLANAFLTALGRMLVRYLPFGAGLLRAADFALTFLGIAALFAMMFHWLPQARPPWRNVWPGALLTATMFVVGKFFLGVYLGRMAVASMYGAAGSLAIVMLWVYYSAQILYLGVEFTKVWSLRHGVAPSPTQARSPKVLSHAAR